MPTRAVLFDLDGTLLDTLADIAAAANRVLAEHGYPTWRIEDYRKLVGRGVRKLFERALPPQRVDRELIESCVAGFHRTYDEHWNAETRPYNGIAPLIGELQRRGCRLAVLSNKPHAFTQRCMDTFFERGTFEVVLGERPGVPPKPDPAGAREVATRLQLPAADILYLGDSDVDMQTACTADMHPVGAAWGFRDREELLAAGAWAVIEHPLDLLELIGAA